MYRIRYTSPVNSPGGILQIDFSAKNATMAWVMLAECEQMVLEPCGICGGANPSTRRAGPPTPMRPGAIAVPAPPAPDPRARPNPEPKEPRPTEIPPPEVDFESVRTGRGETRPEDVEGARRADAQAGGVAQAARLHRRRAGRAQPLEHRTVRSMGAARAQARRRS